MARCFYSLLVLLVFSTGEGQSQRVQDSASDQYRDFVLADQQIWAVTNIGKLKVFDWAIIGFGNRLVFFFKSISPPKMKAVQIHIVKKRTSIGIE